MAPHEGRDGGPETVLRSIGEPSDERSCDQSSTSTVHLPERTHEHDHIGSSRSDRVLAAEPTRGHGAVVMVDQVANFLIGAPATEFACVQAGGITVDQTCGCPIEEAPAAENAGKNCHISALDHALAVESPDAAEVPAHRNYAPSTDQAPAGKEGFGHPGIVSIEQAPEAGQSAIATTEQVSGRVWPQGPGDRPPGRRRNRWDQAPSRCLNCRVLLCTDCAFVNPCGCREWAAGYGYPVPILPRYEISEECIVDSPILLSAYPRWQLFYTSRVGDQVWYWFYSAEDAYNNPYTVRYQFHRYETNGRSWSRFHCMIIDYPGREVYAYFEFPPASELDELVVQYLVSVAQRRRSAF